MNAIIRHIEYLISRNDCVIIPDFGALLANKVKATYSEDGTTLLPPRRIFTFNSDLRHNDGLLVTSVQRCEGISYEAALKLVQREVDSMITNLRWTGSLQLGSIGTIRSSETDGIITFVCDDQQSLSPDTLWLEPIQLRPVAIEQQGQVIEAPIQKQRGSIFKRFVRAAASIAVLLGIGFVASTPMPVDDAMPASLAPEVHKVEYKDLLPETEVIPSFDIALPETQDAVINVVDTNRKSANRYYVVIASVPTKIDAQRYMSENPRLKLGYKDMGTYYILYTSAYDDVYKAYRASYKAAETYPGAWVCKK